MADASITARIGGDASGLVAALEQGKQAAGKFADDFGKVMERKLGMKDVIKGVFQGIGIASVGAVVEKLVAPFKDAADSAQRIEQYTQSAADATERMLMARKNDVQQLEAMEKKLRAIMSGQGEVADEPGIMQRIANKLKGSAVGRVAQYFAGDPQQAENERMAARQAKAAEVAMAIDAKRKEISEKKYADEIKSLKEISKNEDERADAHKKRAEFEREERMAKMTDQQKLVELTKEKEAVDKQIAKYTKFEKEGGEFTALGEKEFLELKQKEKDLRGDIVEITKKQAVEEKKVTAAVKETLNGIAGIKGGNQFNNATDGALAEVARRNRAEAQKYGSGAYGFGIGQENEKARLISEAMNAEKELKFRAKLRGDVAIGGVEGARRNFQGDPLAFDQVVSRLVEDNRSANQLVQEQTDELVKIKNMMKGGIPVVFSGGSS